MKVYIEKYFVYVVLSKCSFEFPQQTSFLQTGHALFLCSHLSMQLGWKEWEHGKVLICWPSA